MKRLTSLLVCVLPATATLVCAFLSPSLAFGTTRYIAQNAGKFIGGTACNGQTAITPATWNSTSEVPGDISYICGTITGTAGQQLLTFGWSGSSSNPIALVFDTGAILASPAWSGGGAIAVPGKSNIVIDGGTNGILENTANGTGLTYNQQSNAVSVQGTNIIVQNLRVKNLCQRSAGDTTECETGGNSSGGIGCTGGCTNVTFTKNSVSSAGTGCLSYGPHAGDSNVTFSYNTLTGCNWGIGVYGTSSGASTGLSIMGNDISCTIAGACIWDESSNNDHHNGIILFPQNTDIWRNTVIANNYIHDIASSPSKSTCGGGAGCVTGYIFLDPSSSGDLPGVQVYNNLLVQANSFLVGPSNAFITDGRGVSGALIFNNTISGIGSQGISGQVSPTWENNVIVVPSAGGIVFGSDLNIGYSNVTIDYNAYMNEIAVGGSADNDTQFSTLTTWRNSGWCTSKCDAHSTNVNPNLDSDYRPQSGSSVIGQGINLTSTGIGGLNQGAPQYFGVNYACGNGCTPRSANGNWDIGAYPNLSRAGNQPASPTNLVGKVQ